MIEHPHTDKVRFVDLGVETDPLATVHSVEVSDSRSTAHFVTAFTMGKRPGRAAAIIAANPERDQHNAEIYHRDDGGAFWVNRHWRKATSRGWTNHLHWTFDHAPTIQEITGVLVEFGDGVRSAMYDEIVWYYRQLAIPRAA